MQPVQTQPVKSANAPGATIHESRINEMDFLDRLITDPPFEDRFRSCVPFYTLRPAAGNFGLDPEMPLNGDPAGWIAVDDARPDMLVLKVSGKSMEQLIPDGAFCLFRSGSPLGGSRNGRTVLVQSSRIFDPDTESSFTVKHYRSIKTEDPETGWRQSEIFLEPVNKDFEIIRLDPAREDEFAIIGKFIRVLRERKDAKISWLY